MIPAQVDLVFYQGSQIDVLLEWLDQATGDPVNLTGYTAIATFRREVGSSTALFTLASATGGIVVGGAAGTLLLTGPAPNSSIFDEPRGEWDLFVTASGVSTVVCRGNVKFIQAVTR